MEDFFVFIKYIILHCLKCRENTEKKSGRIMLLSKCAVCIVKNLNISKNKKLIRQPRNKDTFN